MFQYHARRGRRAGGWRLNLPSGYCVGLGTMIGDDVSWLDWSRYVWFMRYRKDGFQVWQLRILWLYIGRKRTQRVL